MIARLFLHIIVLLMVYFPLSGFAVEITSSIAPGLNVVGVTAAQVAGQQTAFPLLTAWKPSGVTAIESYNTVSGTMLRAELDGGGNPSGVDFPLAENSALYVYSTQLTTLSLGTSTPCAPLNLATGFSLFSYTCFPPGYPASDFLNSVGLANITSLSRLDVPSGRWQTAAVDGGVIVGDDFPLNAGEGYVVSFGTMSGWSMPTIDLSPLTILTGLTFTYPLTVNLSSVAPPGGFPVTLTAAPSGIVSVPASVTIPAGASSVQVTVTANVTTTGTATISATSPGRGVSGSQNVVTVVPIQNMTYTPLFSPQVGVQVGPVFTGIFPNQLMSYGPLSTSQVGVFVGDVAVVSTSVNATYTPVTSGEVGVAVGPVITGISPNHGAIGDNAIPLTVSGYGLNTVTGIAFLPATGITVGTLAVAPDGLSIAVPIDIAANAAIGDRTMLVTTATGTIISSRGGADVFKVTLPTPEMYSVQPLRAMVGQAVSMTISGRYFGAASSVDFTPSTGIAVSNPPTVNAGGTAITVSFTIAANAPLVDRVVTVTTPGGVTSVVASITNTFSVTADLGSSYASFSAPVGVEVQTAGAATTGDVTYGPTASLPVGVTVGSTITAIAPVSGAIGSANLLVRALGNGLGTATGISLQPPDGITIKSFAIGGDGNPEVVVDIAANAPVTPRTVLVTLASGGYALPTHANSNLFRVTLPTPEIYSLQPIRAMVGQIVVMTITGTNFGLASSVDFTPASGISVTNPPTVSPDGTMVTVSFTIAANAPLGDRVVTVTTPGGTSAASASIANTFTVTADQGTTYTPLLSPMVGVLVSPAINTPVVTQLGPVVSAGVGVMVDLPLAATSQNVDYGPFETLPVGVAVGGVFTGFSPGTMEPGSSVTFTLTGIGLDAVNGITIIPSANLTVTAWTPAGDGLSGTVTVTADSGAAQGIRTLVPMVGAAALAPSGPGVGLLKIGYKPVLNSLSTTYPQSSVLAALGSTVTLTLNGVHLQGVTRVEVITADGITVDASPTWFNDGSEHVSVKIIVSAGALVGNRLIRVSTPYGSTSSVLDVTNTLSVVVTVAEAAPAVTEPIRVAAKEADTVSGRDALTAARLMALYGVAGRKVDVASLAVPLSIAVNGSGSIAGYGIPTGEEDPVTTPVASRGPPVAAG